MPRTTDIGRRVELVSMDPHCANISIGLYRQEGARYRVHTYSNQLEAGARIDFISRAMAVLGGMELVDGQVRHGCGELHAVATRRTFLEAAKLPSSAELEARELSILDK